MGQLCIVVETEKEKMYRESSEENERQVAFKKIVSKGRLHNSYHHKLKSFFLIC